MPNTPRWLRPADTKPEDPPPYVPEAPDPVEAAMIAAVEARGDRHAGEIIPEETP